MNPPPSPTQEGRVSRLHRQTSWHVPLSCLRVCERFAFVSSSLGEHHAVSMDSGDRVFSQTEMQSGARRNPHSVCALTPEMGLPPLRGGASLSTASPNIDVDPGNETRCFGVCERFAFVLSSLREHRACVNELRGSSLQLGCHIATEPTDYSEWPRLW